MIRTFAPCRTLSCTRQRLRIEHVNQSPTFSGSSPYFPSSFQLSCPPDWPKKSKTVQRLSICATGALREAGDSAHVVALVCGSVFDTAAENIRTCVCFECGGSWHHTDLCHTQSPKTAESRCQPLALQGPASPKGLRGVEGGFGARTAACGGIGIHLATACGRAQE
jgi:hypothetical protein